MLCAGKACFTVEGQNQFELSAGDVVVVPAGAEHGIRSVGSPAAELSYAHYSYDERLAAALIRLLPKAFRISAAGAAMPTFMVSITAMLQAALDGGKRDTVATKPPAGSVGRAPCRERGLHQVNSCWSPIP